MKVSILLVLVVALTVFFAFPSGTKADGVCLNPVFTHCTRFFCDIAWLTAPSPRTDDNPICSKIIPKGSDSCCGPAVFDVIQTIWNSVHDHFQATIDRLIYLRDKVWEPLLNDIDGQIDTEGDNWQGTADQKQAVKDYLHAVVDATRTFIESSGGDWAQCVSGLLHYWAGLVCFGCEPHWPNWVVVNVNGDIILVLDTETCVHLTGQCVPFFNDILQYADNIANALIKLRNALSTSGNDLPSIDFVPFEDLCNGNCPDYICQRFVFGIDIDQTIENDIDNSQDVSTDPPTDSPTTAAPTAKRGEKRVSLRDSDTYDYVAPYLDKFQPGLAEKMLKHFEQVGDVMKEIGKVNLKLNQMHKEKAAGALRVAGTAMNMYNSSGYPATTNGQDSGLDTNVNGAAALISWIRYLLY